MEINRQMLKADARRRTAGYRPSPILTGLIVMGILWVLSLLSFNVMGFGKFQSLLASAPQYANNPDAFFRAYERMVENYHPSVIACLLAVALSMMSYMINVGFTIFSLHVSRGEKADYGNVFDGFGIFFRVLWLGILEGLFIFLWSLLLWVPGIIAAYRYRQALFLLLDHPEMSVLECITASKELMRGHKGELFVLDLSFLGWILLQGMVPFVAVWSEPYRQISYANYYNVLRSTQGGAASGGGPGPRVYEGHFTDIPDDRDSQG